MTWVPGLLGQQMHLETSQGGDTEAQSREAPPHHDREWYPETGCSSSTSLALLGPQEDSDQNPEGDTPQGCREGVQGTTELARLDLERHPLILSNEGFAASCSHPLRGVPTAETASPKSLPFHGSAQLTTARDRSGKAQPAAGTWPSQLGCLEPASLPDFCLPCSPMGTYAY